MWMNYFRLTITKANCSHSTKSSDNSLTLFCLILTIQSNV